MLLFCRQATSGQGKQTPRTAAVVRAQSQTPCYCLHSRLAKTLSYPQEEEAVRAVEEKGPPLSKFWRDKYEREARKNWDLFYARNADNFFKDRHCECLCVPIDCTADASADVDEKRRLYIYRSYVYFLGSGLHYCDG